MQPAMALLLRQLSWTYHNHMRKPTFRYKSDLLQQASLSRLIESFFQETLERARWITSMAKTKILIYYLLWGMLPVLTHANLLETPTTRVFASASTSFMMLLILFAMGMHAEVDQHLSSKHNARKALNPEPEHHPPRLWVRCTYVDSTSINF